MNENEIRTDGHQPVPVESTVPAASILEVAWRRAVGEEKIPPNEPSLRVRGAWNDYNSRGHGHTTARRVWRNGTWEWVSPPASRGRLRASDRHDVKYGDVWTGEIVAEFTLGGECRPDQWYLVMTGEKPLRRVQASRRRDGCWTLQLETPIPGLPDHVVIPDPAWR